LSHKLEVGERRSLASHYTLTTVAGNTGRVAGNTVWSHMACDFP